ncbi:MAG TPA: fused MFS/spermidine synthase, partial [Arthrobacter sp.]|nr:fused MFS/spermidine synthase [Arthrobacter sp.]
SLAPDVWVLGAWVLSIGGAEQSHVNLADPSDIFYEYLRRLANHLDLLAEPGAPVDVLHLGAGALTLARYVESTRPGSAQVAVDSERELLGFVTSNLPVPGSARLRLVIDDARDVLASQLRGEYFDAIVLDVFAGADAPAHLREQSFHEEIRTHLHPDGIALVNVGDDPPLAFVREQLRTMEAVYRQVTVAAPADLFGGRFPGNFILMGTDAPWDDERLEALRALGPHPGRVLSGVGLDGFRKP